MRRGHLLLLALLSCAAIASTKAQVVGVPKTAKAAAPAVAKATPDEVVARLMSFDRNNDGRITVDELSERMRGLVPKGDASGDGALDGVEVRDLAIVPQGTKAVRGFPLSSAGYGFGDEDGPSSRNHIEGALDDLRLASAIKEQSLPIVKEFVDGLESSAKATLLHELASMLTTEQLAEFTKAFELQQQGRMVIFTNQADVKPITLQFQNHGTLLFKGPMLERHLTRLKLAPETLKEARKLVERYDAALRLDAAKRSDLLNRLSGLLSVEERNNLRAALERRPIVKAGGFAFTTRGPAGGLQPHNQPKIIDTGVAGDVDVVAVHDVAVAGTIR
jgi:hypothetical protein